jgi:hypothetical protein
LIVRVSNRYSKGKTRFYILSTFIIAVFALTSFSSKPVTEAAHESPMSVIPISGILAPSTTYHWYAGGVYSSASTTASEVGTTVKLPSGAPSSTEYYYVILSIWDNTGSYDQIGFSDDYGVWGLTYSYTTGPCTSPTYNYKPDVLTLQAGVKYSFNVSIASGGGIDFDAYKGTKNVYSLYVPNGATSLQVDSTYCGDYGYTVYEEAYMPTSTTVPASSFTFTSNSYHSGSTTKASTWSAFYISSPSVVKVKASGQQCKIIN